MKFMKRYIIHKLGGMVLSDLPPNEQIMILERLANDDIDEMLRLRVLSVLPYYTVPPTDRPDDDSKDEKETMEETKICPTCGAYYSFGTN